MKYITLLTLVVSLGLSACATNPVTGKRDFVTISEVEEIRQGQRYHEVITTTYGIYDDPALQQYVDRIGQELAAKSHRAHLKFTFTVLDSPDINAFALPGGYVYVTRGIMAYLGSEAELAGVIGHEIGHVTARHSVRQQGGQFASNIFGILVAATTGDQSLTNLSQQLSTGLIRGYGRDHELEADRLGAEYLHTAGYDPENMLEVIGVLKDQEVYERALAAKEKRQPNIYHGVFSTHPRNDDRLKTVVRKAKKLSVKTYRDDNQAGYEKMIDGMVWGPSVNQGVVVNNRFSHPDLAIGLQLPRGWKVDNNPRFLEARNPGTGALVQIGVQPLNKNESLDGLLKRLTQSKELKVSKQAYGVTASTRIKPRGGDYQPARVSAIALENSQALTLFGTSSKDHFADTNKKLLAINKSFRHLNQAQIDAIKVPRLKIVRRNSQSFENLAQQSALEYEAENTLRLLNRAFPKGDIKTFDRLKTITLDD